MLVYIDTISAWGGFDFKVPSPIHLSLIATLKFGGRGTGVLCKVFDYFVHQQYRWKLNGMRTGHRLRFQFSFICPMDGVLLGSSIWSRVVEQIPTRPKKGNENTRASSSDISTTLNLGGARREKKLSLSCPDCWQLGSWFGCLKI